jgi:hypothetical protein
MKEEMFISDKKIEKLCKKIAKTFSLSEDEALSIIYEEWDIVETLFYTYGKVKLVHEYLIEEINYTYRIA